MKDHLDSKTLSLLRHSTLNNLYSSMSIHLTEKPVLSLSTYFLQSHKLFHVCKYTRKCLICKFYRFINNIARWDTSYQFELVDHLDKKLSTSVDC